MNQSATDPDDLAHVEAGFAADLDTLVVYNLLRTAAQLGPQVDAALRERQMTSTKLNALLLLRQAGATGLQMGEIGRRLVVTKSNVTGLIDRLEARGWVERLAQADRRATRVRLTSAGDQAIEAVSPAHSTAMAEVTAGLSEREKRQLVTLMSKVRRQLRRRSHHTGRSG